MEELTLIWNSIAKDSPAIILAILFFWFWIWNAKNVATPAGQSVLKLVNQIIDDVVKPMIPVAEGVLGFLEVQGRAAEVQARSSQQMVDVVQNSMRITQELFDTRFTQEQRAREEQAKVFQEEIRDLKNENEKLRNENKSLKAEVAELKEKLAAKQDKKTGDTKKE